MRPYPSRARGTYSTRPCVPAAGRRGQVLMARLLLCFLIPVTVIVHDIWTIEHEVLSSRRRRLTGAHY